MLINLSTLVALKQDNFFLVPVITAFRQADADHIPCVFRICCVDFCHACILAVRCDLTIRRNDQEPGEILCVSEIVIGRFCGVKFYEVTHTDILQSALHFTEMS